MLVSTAALAGQRTLAISELQSTLRSLQDIESQEEQLLHAAQDRESQVRLRANAQSSTFRSIYVDSRITRCRYTSHAPPRIHLLRHRNR